MIDHSLIPILVRSGVLEHVPHGFSTRRFGVSKGMFDSLNFGNPGELSLEERDSPANIAQNFARVLEFLECRRREIVEVHQVHGAEVHVVRQGERTHAGERDTKADAIVTDDPGRMLAVRVADCAPVLLASEDGRIVAAAHAGWRGIIQNVVARTVEEMRAMGAEHINASVGPCISADAFEVGDEVTTEFVRVFGDDPTIIRRGAGKPHVDIKSALSRQLREAGVKAIEVLPQCTVGDAMFFFSHRRDKGRTGRMIGIIGPRD